MTILASPQGRLNNAAPLLWLRELERIKQYVEPKPTSLRRQPLEKLVQAFRRSLPGVRAALARLGWRQAVMRLIREEPDIECPW
jgi:hypothetical protein